MKKTTNVFLREDKVFNEIAITNASKPRIEKIFTDRWQKIIDLVAKIFHVPAALIMQVNQDSMNVFLKSNNKDNPY